MFSPISGSFAGRGICLRSCPPNTHYREYTRRQQLTWDLDLFFSVHFSELESVNMFPDLTAARLLVPVIGRSVNWPDKLEATNTSLRRDDGQPWSCGSGLAFELQKSVDPKEFLRSLRHSL
jgi:hypothetical protein